MKINWYEFLLNKGRGYPIRKKSFGYIGVPFRNGGWVKRLEAVDLTKYDESALVGREIIGATHNFEVDCPPGLYAVHAPLWTTDMETGENSILVTINSYLFRVTDDEITCEVDCIRYNLEDWVLVLRQKAAELLELKSSPLDEFSTEELEAALINRRSGIER